MKHLRSRAYLTGMVILIPTVPSERGVEGGQIGGLLIQLNVPKPTAHIQWREELMRREVSMAT